MMTQEDRPNDDMAESPPRARRLDPSKIASPAEDKIRVLCIDDHEAVLKGLHAQFALYDVIDIVETLTTTTNAEQRVKCLDPDIMLLDIEVPGPDVFETVSRIRDRYPRTRSIFLSAHIRDGYLSAAFKCGAFGYFSKGDNLDSLVEGVIKIAKSESGTFELGSKVRERCIGSRAIDRPTPEASSREKSVSEVKPIVGLDLLSPREIEVLRLIGNGLSRSEIAVELNRSVKTIDGHQERILEKLRLSTRTELIRYAIREGLAEA